MIKNIQQNVNDYTIDSTHIFSFKDKGFESGDRENGSHEFC